LLTGGYEEPKVITEVPPLSSRANAVLDFWFGENAFHGKLSEQRQALWKHELPQVVKYLDNEFAEDMQRAASGRYNTWRHSPKGRLALILLLHQFPKFYTDTKDHVFQSQVNELTLEGIELNQDQQLNVLERAFFYMPLIDSESLELQSRFIFLYRTLLQSLPKDQLPIANYLNQVLEQAENNRAVIYQFGRFPERNTGFDRQTTEEEQQYLKEQ
jgi:uncharacterized protein (DUF924 family)